MNRWRRQPTRRAEYGAIVAGLEVGFEGADIVIISRRALYAVMSSRQMSPIVAGMTAQEALRRGGVGEVESTLVLPRDGAIDADPGVLASSDTEVSGKPATPHFRKGLSKGTGGRQDLRQPSDTISAQKSPAARAGLFLYPMLVPIRTCSSGRRARRQSTL
jgi:hypothetical protein